MGNFKIILVHLFILGYICSDVQGLTCWSCNSNILSDCAQRPDLIIEEVECQVESDKCGVAILTDQSTYRGCTADFPTELAQSSQCEGDKCNGQIYPEDRLQCFQCNGADCLNVADGDELPCKLYDEAESCYTDVIDATDASRGCSSDDYIPGDYSRTCKTSGCNSQPASSTFSCLVCDSVEDGDACRFGTAAEDECTVSIAEKCDMELLFGRLEHCFTYRKGEHVVRGCSRDSPEYVTQPNFIRECILNECNDECISTSQCYVCDTDTEPYCKDQSVGNLTLEDCPTAVSCHTCRDEAGTTHRGCGTYQGTADCAECWNDPGCNNKHMLRCYSCSSADDLECDLWQNTAQISTEICNGNCIATLRNGIVERGCQSNSFDCQPSLTCVSCTEDDCNSGRVPDNRLRCHQCGENDLDCNDDLSAILASSCENVEDETDKCYAFVTNDNRMIRGCTTDLRYNECLLMPAGKCVTCSGDGCNSHPYMGKLSCVKCDSDTDPECKTGIVPGDQCTVDTEQRCDVDVPFTEYEYCYTYRYGERVVRGCSKQDPSFSSLKEYVRECRFDDCNIECIDSTKCYSCDSSTNGNCANNVLMIDQVQCGRDEISCYTCRDSAATIRRGCGSGSTFGQCTSCWDDPGCNQKPMLQCYSCNSFVDAKCAQVSTPEAINTMICNGFCIATLRDGYVVRGCQSNSFDCPASESCIRCDSDNCNSALVPENRITCHQCDENHADCNNERDPSAASVCSTYKADDQCFLFLNDQNKMVRGCVSDARYEDCANNNDKCIVCNDAGCNSMSATKTPALECATCNGEESCAWAQTKSDRCVKQIPYYATETCFITKEADDSFRRGCTLDQDGTCDSGSCSTCLTSGCNNGNRIYQNCLQCSGKGTEPCATGNVTSSECGALIQPYETRGCYAKRDGEAVTRGCLYSWNDDEKKACESDEKNCQVCYDQECNTKDLRSNSSHLNTSWALLLAVIIYVAKDQM